VGHQSIDKPFGSSATLVDLGKDRLLYAKNKYDKLEAQCFEVSLNKEKAGIPKWLQNKLKAEGKSQLLPRVYQMSKTNPADLRKVNQKSQNTNKRPILKEKPKPEKKYDKRHIFVIADG